MNDSQSYTLLRTNLVLIVLFMTFDKDDEEDRVYLKYALSALGLYGAYSMLYETSFGGGEAGSPPPVEVLPDLPALNIHNMNYQQFISTEKYLSEPVPDDKRNFLVGNLSSMTGYDTLGSYTNEQLVILLQAVSDLIPKYKESDLDLTRLPLIQRFTDSNIVGGERNLVVYNLSLITKISGDTLSQFDNHVYKIILLRITGTTGLPEINIGDLDFSHYNTYNKHPFPKSLTISNILDWVIKIKTNQKLNYNSEFFWQDLGLDKNDLNKTIKRGEFSVVIDKLLDPFSSFNIDFDGEIINNDL